ncbi:NAD-dependent epimerase/dehydratase family protein [Sulfidibacter corallicola]|uniref:NAD-dependent epimerase/dehydratase family protein n=1 Tax=Sulfidibacter corallicola TaxID=2818388 RepID=A0A8A4TQ98_SULCO|nr:NAD-dependent epimerase/dehydratase family protein [Sulfidibacter corallicola]QTD52156.1 NAD-dependent epimerase/dehydratase family protein [Sulfidibacter corallicola]
MTQSRLCVLVTGAAGSLAGAIIRRLKPHCDIVAVDFRKRVDLEHEIPSYKVDFNKRGFEDVFRNHDIDAVIHIGRVSTEESNLTGRYNANVLGTQRLLKLALKYDIRQVVVLSTFFVYGANAQNPSLLTEDAPLKASGLTLDMVDSVELENLCNIYMWKHPNLHITILRPCHIAGPGVRNTISRLLSSRIAPVLLGFSPLMQFLHVEDMAGAVVLAFEKNQPGIYNVAPHDWITYQDALLACDCTRFPLISIPPIIPEQVTKIFNWKSFPSHLLNYFKYPVIIDGSLFVKTFGFEPRFGLKDIFEHYREGKRSLV